MLKSLNAAEEEARKLVRSWKNWIDGSAEQVLTPKTPTRPVDLENLRSAVDGFARRARDIEALPGFQNLKTDPELRDLHDDVVAIAEEMEAGSAEIVAESEPDVVYARLGAQKKKELTQIIALDESRVDLIRARLRGDIRKQAKPIQGGDKFPTPAAA